MNPVVHFEMPYRDGARAGRFYTAAFGWQTQMLGEAMGHYITVTTATQDARPGAPGRCHQRRAVPLRGGWPAQHPGVVIGVEDLAAAMARVAAAGGQVLGEPMDIPGVGAYVAFMDTEGNRHAMLKPLMA